MKQLTTLAILVIAGPLAWMLASRLSTDALGLAFGVVLGLLAMVPAVALALAPRLLAPAAPPPPVVIVLTDAPTRQLPQLPTVDSYAIPARRRASAYIVPERAGDDGFSDDE